MGGYGSGRWDGFRNKATTESQYRIDIRWLKKQKCLGPGTSGFLIWSHRGQTTTSINYRMEEEHMVLNYCRRAHNAAEWEPVSQTIAFDRTPCHYGGYRLWFRCPHCHKRIAILYGVGKYFLCRHCYDLIYTSQLESMPYRLIRKARRIRELLGASEDLSEPIWIKPKHMHQKTFGQLKEKEDQVNTMLELIIAKLLYDTIEI